MTHVFKLLWLRPHFSQSSLNICFVVVTIPEICLLFGMDLFIWSIGSAPPQPK